MSVVRVSILHCPPEKVAEVEALMKAAESPLSGIKKLKGLKAYFAGVDREKSEITNVSVWETEADAQQMASFQPMQELAKEFMKVEGLTFVRPIPNFDVIWQWGDASGGGSL
jgi:hypothetical protein